MIISNDVLEAARTLGSAVSASPAVQEYLQAREALENSAELSQLAEEIEQVYQGLIGRQQKGEVLSHDEVNAFYAMRDRYTRHPLVVRHNQSQEAVKALCEQVGGTISSILSVDYTQLAAE